MTSRGPGTRHAANQQRVLDTLAGAPVPLTRGQIITRLFEGKHVSGAAVTAALRALVAAGRVLSDRGHFFSLPPLAP